MTVSATEPLRSDIYISSGQATFPFPFSVFAPNEVVVGTAPTAAGPWTRLFYGTDYAVALAADNPGGTFTLTPAVPTGTFVMAVPLSTLSQDRSFSNQSALFFNEIEKSLDKVTIMVRQVQDRTRRAPSVGPFNTARDLVLPTPAVGKLLIGAVGGWVNGPDATDIQGANDAAAAAVTAAATAQGANTAAQSAKTAAETARTAAQTARTDAQTARTDAQTARTDAQTANTDAQTAKTAAETAAANINVASYPSLAALLASSGAITVGTIVQTRLEGFSYAVVASGEKLTTTGGVKLLPYYKAEGLNVYSMGAAGNDAANDTAAFSFTGAPDRIRVPRGVYRVANNVGFAGVDIVLEAGASLKHTDGTVWAGGLDGVYVGGPSASPFASERAYPARASRAMSPSTTLVVDNVGANATSPDGFTYCQKWRRHYRGQVTDGYQVIDNVESFVAYGLNMTAGQRASGSMRAMGSRIHVYSAANAGSGITELQGGLHGLRCEPGAPIDNGLNFWVRETSGSGKVGDVAADFDSYLAGDTILTQKYTAGRGAAAAAAGKVYNGAFGMVLTTVPKPGAFQGASMLDKPTYPLDAMLAIAGYTGPDYNTAYDGHDTKATPGATFGVRIGAVLGGIWMGASERSRFIHGIHVDDCTHTGITVGGGHPLKVAEFCALRTTPEAMNVLLGTVTNNQSARLEVTSGAQYNDSIYLAPRGVAASRRATINFGGDAIVGTDVGGSGSKNLTIYVNTTSRMVFEETGNVLRFPNLPTSAPAGAGAIWNNAGTLRIT